MLNLHLLCQWIPFGYIFPVIRRNMEDIIDDIRMLLENELCDIIKSLTKEITELKNEIVELGGIVAYATEVNGG